MKLLKLREVAERLSVSERSVWQLAATGELPVLRMGRIVRVPDEVLDEWIRSRTQPARLAPRPRRKPIPLRRGKARKVATG